MGHRSGERLSFQMKAMRKKSSAEERTKFLHVLLEEWHFLLWQTDACCVHWPEACVRDRSCGKEESGRPSAILGTLPGAGSSKPPGCAVAMRKIIHPWPPADPLGGHAGRKGEDGV